MALDRKEAMFVLAIRTNGSREKLDGFMKTANIRDDLTDTSYDFDRNDFNGAIDLFMSQGDFNAYVTLYEPAYESIVGKRWMYGMPPIIFYSSPVSDGLHSGMCAILGSTGNDKRVHECIEECTRLDIDYLVYNFRKGLVRIKNGVVIGTYPFLDKINPADDTQRMSAYDISSVVSFYSASMLLCAAVPRTLLGCDVVRKYIWGRNQDKKLLHIGIMPTTAGAPFINNILIRSSVCTRVLYDIDEVHKWLGVCKKLEDEDAKAAAKAAKAATGKSKKGGSGI